MDRDGQKCCKASIAKCEWWNLGGVWMFTAKIVKLCCVFEKFYKKTLENFCGRTETKFNKKF